MAFWCENHLQVSGDTKTVRRFMKKNFDRHSELLSFNALKPLPHHLRHPMNQEAAKQWALDNWGTRHSIMPMRYHFTVEPEPLNANLSVLNVYFLTEWSTPSQWLQHASSAYPKLNFSLWFDEPELQGSGGYHFRKGVFSEQGSWDMQPSHLRGVCAAENCRTPVIGLTAYQRQESMGKDPNLKCCSEHQLVEAVLKYG